VAWYRETVLEELVALGVDGFKFDGGDPDYYRQLGGEAEELALEHTKVTAATAASRMSSNIGSSCFVREPRILPSIDAAKRENHRFDRGSEPFDESSRYLLNRHRCSEPPAAFAIVTVGLRYDWPELQSERVSGVLQAGGDAPGAAPL
jgi:hypothetical protein